MSFGVVVCVQLVVAVNGARVLHFVFYISFPFAPCALCDVTLGSVGFFFSLVLSFGMVVCVLRERNEGRKTNNKCIGIIFR